MSDQQQDRTTQVPLSYRAAGVIFTATFITLFFVGPRVPYVFPANELINSIGWRLYAVAFILTMPLWMYVGSYCGRVMWEITRGESNAE